MPKVGLLWRAEWDPPEAHGSIIESCKLREMFRSFAALGVPAQPVVYSDDTTEAVRDQLLTLDGVLVWVNPIEQGLDRTQLDAVLRDVADAGVWVSAHPDVILKMATKQVLVDTKQMSWGTDTRLYRSAEELRADLPSRIGGQAPLVLKQNRGMGGNGVWKVEPGPRATTLRFVCNTPCGTASRKRCRWTSSPHAASRTLPGTGRWWGAVRRASGRGGPRLHDTQSGRGIRPSVPTRTLATSRRGPDSDGKDVRTPSAAAYRGPAQPHGVELVPEMQELLSLDTHKMPVIWDADFLYGTETTSEDDA